MLKATELCRYVYVRQDGPHRKRKACSGRGGEAQAAGRAPTAPKLEVLTPSGLGSCTSTDLKTNCSRVCTAPHLYIHYTLSEFFLGGTSVA